MAERLATRKYVDDKVSFDSFPIGGMFYVTEKPVVNVHTFFGDNFIGGFFGPTKTFLPYFDYPNFPSSISYQGSGRISPSNVFGGDTKAIMGSNDDCSKILAVDDSYNVYESTNGQTFTKISKITNYEGTISVGQLLYLNNQWVLICWGKICFSNDGINWRNGTDIDSGYLNFLYFKGYYYWSHNGIVKRSSSLTGTYTQIPYNRPSGVPDGDRFAGIGTDGKYLYTTNCRKDDDGYVVLRFLFSEDGNSWTYNDRFISGYSSEDCSPYYVLPGGVDGTNHYIITGKKFYYFNENNNTFVILTTSNNTITNYMVKNFQGFSVIVPITNVSPFTWYSISKHWKPEKYTNEYFNNNQDSYHSVAVLNGSFYINYGGYMYSNYYYRYLLGKYCETSDDTQYVKIK